MHRYASRRVCVPDAKLLAQNKFQLTPQWRRVQVCRQHPALHAPGGARRR